MATRRNRKQRFINPSQNYVFVNPEGVALATGGESISALSSKANGTIGVYTPTGTGKQLISTASALGPGQKFVIAQKNGNQIQMSAVLCLDTDFNNKSKTAASTGTKQETFVGYNGTSGSMNYTPVAGDTVGIAIYDTTTLGTLEDQDVYTFTHLVKTGDTVETIIDALVAQINDSKNTAYYSESFKSGNIYSAAKEKSGTDLGIKITTTYLNETFYVGLKGEFANPLSSPSIDYATAVAMTSGLGEDVLAMELDGLAFKGNTHRYKMDPNNRPKPVEFTDVNLNYTTINISANNYNRSTAMPALKVGYESNTVVALASSDSTLLDTVLGL